MGTYICSMCGGEFEEFQDETWNNEKALEEYGEVFAGYEGCDMAVVCDDCYNKLPKPAEVEVSDQNIINAILEEACKEPDSELDILIVGLYRKFLVDGEVAVAPDKLIKALHERWGK